MKLIKNNRLKSKNVPLTEEERERRLKKNKRINFTVSGFFIVFGVQGLALAITSKQIPGNIQALEMVLFFAMLLLILRQGAGFNKHKLAPIDEYEAQQEAASKAKAFNFLSTGVFFIIILFPQNWALPLLYILIGYSWILAGRTEDDGKETAK
jgi:hypothetical protein